MKNKKIDKRTANFKKGYKIGFEKGKNYDRFWFIDQELVDGGWYYGRQYFRGSFGKPIERHPMLHNK